MSVVLGGVFARLWRVFRDWREPAVCTGAFSVPPALSIVGQQTNSSRAGGADPGEPDLGLVVQAVRSGWYEVLTRPCVDGPVEDAGTEPISSAHASNVVMLRRPERQQFHLAARLASQRSLNPPKALAPRGNGRPVTTKPLPKRQVAPGSSAVRAYRQPVGLKVLKPARATAEVISLADRAPQRLSITAARGA